MSQLIKRKVLLFMINEYIKEKSPNTPLITNETLKEVISDSELETRGIQELFHCFALGFDDLIKYGSK
jgi:hypothetical protein